MDQEGAAKIAKFFRGYALTRFDPLRRESEWQIQMGGAIPEVSLSTTCMRSASPSRPEKSLALASAQGNLGTPDVAQQMRRLFGSRGGAVRRDISAATDLDLDPNGAPQSEKTISGKGM